jgi:hypothetical protein
METQSILFDNKEKIPNGLYVELMNALKKDFSAPKNKINKIEQLEIKLQVAQKLAIEYARKNVELESELECLKSKIEKEIIEKILSTIQK